MPEFEYTILVTITGVKDRTNARMVATSLRRDYGPENCFVSIIETKKEVNE